MKTFIELATEIKKSIDKEDTNVLASIANSVELSAVATTPHALGSYLIYDKKVYEVTTAISVGDTLVIYPATGYNIKVADDIMTMLEDEATTRSTLGAKNILPFDLADIKALNTNGTWAGNVYSYCGVDFTVNSDGTISATGTATGGNASIKIFAASSNYEMLGKEVILNGCPSGGSASTYRIQAYRMGSVDGSTGTYFDDGDGTIAFDALNNASGTVGSFAVAVYENTTVTNLLFKPMVRLASDPDDTYQPYAKTNQELTADSQVAAGNDDAMLNLLGAKNLMPITATTQVINDVTYTVRDNSTANYYLRGTVRAVRSSTSSDNAWITLVENLVLPRGSYILSGCPSGGSTDSYLLAFDTDIQTTTLYESGNGLAFTVTDGEKIRVRIRCAPTFDGDVVFYPMIRPASVADDTYVPYAMTNRELTVREIKSVAFNAIYPQSVTTSIQSLFEKTASLHISDYYVDDTNNLSDWGTKTHLHYCDVKIARYGATATIIVTGCLDTGTPAQYIGQRITGNYYWKLVTTS